MSNKLPQRIDPFRAAEQGRILSGLIPMRHLPRLLEAIAEPGAEDLLAEFRFMRDEARRSFVELICRVTLRLRCERCLGAVHHELDLRQRLALLDRQASGVEQNDDALIVNENGLVLRELLEDELLLALPLIPRHESLASCDQGNVTWINKPETGKQSAVKKESDNPFKILRTLKD